MSDIPSTSELPPTGQSEGPSVPKPPEAKPPEQPISPGAQRIIDSIRNGGQGAPREVLENIAGGKPKSEGVVIDMVKGPDGKWEARKPGDPENSTGIDANPQTSSESGNTQKPRDTWELEQARRQANQERNEFWVNFQQRGQVRPRARPKPSSERPSNWREATPNFSAVRPANLRRQEDIPLRDREAEKQQELHRLQADGSRLAALVYTPEGQKLIAAVRTRLTQIVEVTLRKPKLETVSSFEHYQPAIAEVIQRNDQLLQVWQQSKEARVDSLLRGESMTSSEIDAYLASVLGHESNPMTRNDAENQKRSQLLEQFDRTRRDIGRALLYQSSEAKPVGQRHLLLSRETLDRYDITTSEAQESFARGWEGAKAQSLQQSQGRPKL